MPKKPIISPLKVQEEISFLSWTLYYSVLPIKLTICYNKGENTLREIYKKALVSFPSLYEMDIPKDVSLACVYKSATSDEIFLFIKDGVTPGIIVHECVHIVSRVFDHIGSTFTEASEEFFAYYLDYTFDEIIKACKEKLKIDIKL